MNQGRDRADDGFKRFPQLLQPVPHAVQNAVLLHRRIEQLHILQPRLDIGRSKLPDRVPKFLHDGKKFLQLPGIPYAIKKIAHASGEIENFVLRRRTKFDELLPKRRGESLKLFPFALCDLDVLVELIPVLTESRLLALHVTVIIVNQEQQRADEHNHARERRRLHHERKSRDRSCRYFDAPWEAVPHAAKCFPDIPDELKKVLADVDNIDQTARSFFCPDAHILDERIVEAAELLAGFCERSIQILHEVVSYPRHRIADFLLKPRKLKHEIAEVLHCLRKISADLHFLSVGGQLLEACHQLRRQHDVLNGFAERVRGFLHRPRRVLRYHHLTRELLHGKVLLRRRLHQSGGSRRDARDRRRDNARGFGEIRRHVPRRRFYRAVKILNRRFRLLKTGAIHFCAQSHQIFLDHLANHVFAPLSLSAYASARRRFSRSTRRISCISSKSPKVYVPSHSSCCCHRPAMTGAYTQPFTF